MEKEKFVCCICGGTFVGFGNNPYPLCHREDYDSRCCNDCDNLVIQARMTRGLTDKELQLKFLGKVCEKK